MLTLQVLFMFIPWQQRVVSKIGSESYRSVHSSLLITVKVAVRNTGEMYFAIGAGTNARLTIKLVVVLRNFAYSGLPRLTRPHPLIVASFPTNSSSEYLLPGNATGFTHSVKDICSTLLRNNPAQNSDRIR